MKILFVENHDGFRTLVIRKFLKGMDVTTARSIAEAVRRLRDASFDGILIDYDLDDGKGTEVVRAIRAKGGTVRVIGVSSHDRGNDELLKAGADAICPKAKFRDIRSFLQ